ncbi:hypothetical protein [Flavobacterium sp.]|uniref:hypothetical protein n=1 Tax=Flavobacterium sp. TaxID=239 RepID=UPI0039E50752
MKNPALLLQFLSCKKEALKILALIFFAIDNHSAKNIFISEKWNNYYFYLV